MSLTLGIIASSRGNIVPPLDTYGGAAAAYSTRLLSSAYGGSAVRVRRSFDNAEQDIGFSGGAIDETALMNFVGYQNLLQRSEEFNDAYWTKVSAIITSNSTLAPDGTTTADSFIANTGTGVHALVRVFTGTPTTYTSTIYVKGITGSAYNWVLIGLYNGTAYTAQAFFNVVTGQVGNILSGTVVSPVSVGNGWWRIGIIGDLTASASCEVNVILAPSNGGSTTFTGDGTSGVFVWGAQLNIGTSAQPYQVTTSAARSGDGFVTKWYTQDSNGENLILQSQTFENVYWVKVNSSVSTNATTAPDGTLTAEKLIDTTSNAYHACTSNTVSITGSIPYTISLYVKAAELSTGAITLYSDVPPYDSSFGIVFNLTTGTATPSANGAAVLLSGGISNVGGGWYRVWATGFTNRTNIHRFDISLGAYLGTGTQGLFIWGAQLSQSTWLQGYQATTTSQVFRRDASQSTAANQPRIVGGGVIERENGKASIFFDGVNDHFVGTDIALPVWSIFSTAVQNVTNVSGIHSIYSRGSSSNNSRDAILYLVPTIGVQAQRSNAVAFPSSSAYTSIRNYLLASGIFSGSSITAFADSISGAPISTSIAGSATPVTLIGATVDNGSTLYYMGGEIGEVIVYNSDRTSTRADIERNIGSYYQTQWTGASSGLLDQFGGAAAAYSLRNLSSSYRGPLIRVRRSSDNAETDIGGTYNGDLDVASLLSFTGGQNLLTNSEDFTNALWTKLNTAVTANATIAPDGTLTSDKFTETAVNGFHALYQDYSVPSIGPMTLSFYAKAAERRYIGVAFYSTSSPFSTVNTIFDIVNGSVSSSTITASGVLISSSIQSVGNGWYRCSVTGNINATGASRFQIGLWNSEITTQYLGVAGSGVYIWGAQLNTGILQPYIPTTTTAVNGANAFVTKWYTQDNNYQNLLLQSQTFENASWVKSGTSVTQDVTVAPDGTSTADKLISTALNGFIYQNSASFPAFGNNSASINLNDGTVSAIIAGSFDTIGTTSVGNGWWRIYASKLGYTFSYYAKKADWDYTVIQLYSLTGSNGAYIYPANAPNVPLGNGGGTQGIFIWGAQVNEGSVAFPYTATTTTVSQRRDAIQATAASQPRIVNAGGVESEGNRPALFFDGVDDTLTTSQAVITSNNFSTFAAFASNSSVNAVLIGQHAGLADTYRTVFIGSGASPFVGSAYIFYADPPSIYQATTSSTQVFDGTGSIVYSDTNGSGLTTIGFNGVQDGSVNGTIWTPLNTPLRIGSVGPSSPSAFLVGRISETFLYNSRQTSPQAISSNINSYYRIYWQGNGTALLDSFSGASAAYSLRNLSSAYTGPLIRVRRSSDNVERDIYGTFGGDLDIASLVAFVGANSGFVTTWYDQSGNARHAAQTTAANQPRIVNAGVVDTENGKPTLFFDGTNDFMNMLPVGVENLEYSMFHVSKNNTAVSMGFGVGNSTISGGPYFGRFNDGKLYIQYVGPTDYYYSSNDISTTFNLRSGFARATSVNVYINGVDASPVLAGTFIATSPNFDLIGKHVNNPTANAQASEVILYASNRLTSRTAIESNINNYYKIY